MKRMTKGAAIISPANSREFPTGDWRTMKPIWIEKKCTQCMLCWPVCPDMAIPVKNGKRLDYDYDFCKGCGICVKVCPFDAIDFVEQVIEEEDS
ncbi:MAG: 4Fe-4S binding protein [Xylanivirga thermophila]|jgi:pyruvate ferredoxin oxidoreductase delta subunit|uniref:4Fe-4S binding protein n=1 Tax=Xylanivirga thermophila TaxID=2496273 RepID=UPI00101D24E2|nr:4Fe-4S binding protein [Xylanivirga thermophila]